MQGDIERRRTFASIAYDYAVEVGDVLEMSECLCLLAEAVLLDGNPSLASEHLSQAIELGRKLDSQPILGAPMRLGVSIAFASGDYRLAIRWMAAIEESTTRLGLPLDSCTEQDFMRYRSIARREIGKRAASIEAETGRSLSIDRAAAEVAAYRPGKRGAAALTELGIVRLTARETEVLGLIASGLSDVEIADTLHIARPTASRHVSNILLKLQVHTRTAAVDKAHRAGLLQSPVA
jgi:DNA-binding CsgD family transcriptional regulator